MVIAKHGLATLLSTNYYFTDLLTGGLLDKEPEQKLVWLCGGILSNIALHPNNRSASMLQISPIMTAVRIYRSDNSRWGGGRRGAEGCESCEGRAGHPLKGWEGRTTRGVVFQWHQHMQSVSSAWHEYCTWQFWVLAIHSSRLAASTESNRSQYNQQ